MPRHKNVSVNFFRAALNSESHYDTKVHDLLKSISKLKPKDRAVDSGADRLLLGEYKKLSTPEHEPDRWRGQLRRIRPNDRIAEGNDTGYFEDAPFKKGFATETGQFMVIPNYKTILYAGSPFECGWTQLRYYLMQFIEDDDFLVVVPILDKKKVKKLDSMKAPKKFVFKVANPEKWSVNADASVEEITSTAAKYDAEWMRLEMGAGRKKDSILDMDIIKLVKECWKIYGSSATKQQDTANLEIEGYMSKDGGSERVAIDFVKDRVKFKERIDMLAIKTIKDWKERNYKILKSAWTKKKSHVTTGFKPSTKPAK